MAHSSLSKAARIRAADGAGTRRAHRPAVRRRVPLVRRGVRVRLPGCRNRGGAVRQDRGGSVSHVGARRSSHTDVPLGSIPTALVPDLQLQVTHWRFNKLPAALLTIPVRPQPAQEPGTRLNQGNLAVFSTSPRSPTPAPQELAINPRFIVTRLLLIVLDGAVASVLTGIVQVRTGRDGLKCVQAVGRSPLTVTSSGACTAVVSQHSYALTGTLARTMEDTVPYGNGAMTERCAHSSTIDGVSCPLSGLARVWGNCQEQGHSVALFTA